MDYEQFTFLERSESRRECFDVTDDALESFFLDLSLDTIFGIQDRTRITLNSTEITIINDNGKSETILTFHDQIYEKIIYYASCLNNSISTLIH